MKPVLEIEATAIDTLAAAARRACAAGAAAIAFRLPPGSDLLAATSLLTTPAAGEMAILDCSAGGLAWAGRAEVLHELIEAAARTASRPGAAGEAAAVRCTRPPQLVFALPELSPVSQALAAAAETLQVVRCAAEAAGVRIALDDAGGRLSPQDAFALLDQVNSPAVGWRLNLALTDPAEPLAAMLDWIETLAGLLFSVRLAPPPPEAAAGAALIAALRRTGYDGPLVLPAGDDPADTLRRARELLGSGSHA